MEAILQMFAHKTTQIQNNFLDLMSTIVEYEDAVKRNQLGPDFGNKVVVNKTVFEAIKELLPKINKNLNTLSEVVDRNIDENKRLTQELTLCRRREFIFERQLNEVRNLYRSLKEEMEWNDICDQMSDSEFDENNLFKQDFNCTEYVKTCLTLIWSSSANQRTVQSFMENEKVFREFMATIRTIFEDQIKVMANSSDSTFDPNLIETIFGICVNVFQCNDYSGEDIPQWIDCFTAIQALDKRFLKSSINALHYISFAPNGIEGLQKKPAIITILAKCLIDSELKHEFKVKINAVKVIRRMIENSKDTEIGVKLFTEFISVIPMESFRHMVGNEVYLILKKNMGGLLTILSLFNTQSITEA